jgi:haloalkane dehalogenase
VSAAPGVFRTPDERFAGLPADFGFEPQYTEVEGLRIAHLDVGDPAAPPVWFMHGEPTWSFLWRKIFPVVVGAGYRAIVPDLAGFGRSDKPTDLEWYSYDGHTAIMAGLLEQLDLRDTTLVVHDWGGSVGMRLFVEHPERFERIAMLDTGLFTGHQRMSDAWLAFRDFVVRTEDLPVGFLVKGACLRGLDDEVVAAYEAPFPTPESKAGARAFPLLIPTDPSMPGAEAGRRVLEAMRADERPVQLFWADKDPIIPLKTGKRFAEAIGAPAPEVIADASHFLQEDAGEEIGLRIAQWLASVDARTIP